MGRDTKRAWLLEHLPRLARAGHKVLVFSQWTRVLRALRRDLTALGLPTMYLDGKTRERATLQARFNAPEGPPVFLISTMAGGTGLTLTGADHVVLHEPWWNPAVEQQAADRAHRIGQTRPVTIWRLVAKDTVEEAMERRQQDKQLLFAGTVESLPTSGRLSPASVQVVLARSLGGAMG